MNLNESDFRAITALRGPNLRSARTKSSRSFTVVLLAVFFVVLMTGLAVGVSMYQSVANNQIDTNQARMQAGLLASNIHANDTENAIGTGNGPEGRSLVLSTKSADGDSFETRIYLYEGKIVQEYSIAGSAYTPDRAQPLINSKSFDFELHGNLLIIFTDQGATNIALRSYQGGDA